MKTKAMVSPSSARMVHVQSALFWYSEGKWGLAMMPLWPRRVPPQASSAVGTEIRVSGFTVLAGFHLGFTLDRQKHSGV